jgi:hypothetical protein
MNVSKSMYALRKRWRLTTTLFVLAGFFIIAAAVVFPKSYQSEAQVVFVASKTDSKLYANNPYLAFGSALTATADIVARSSTDPRLMASLATQGYGSSYTVVDAPNAPSPVLIVTVTGSKSAEVQSTLQAVINTITNQLKTLQSGLHPDDRITSMTLSVSVSPKLSISKMARPIAAVAVLFLALAFSIPVIVEGISARRRMTNSRPDKPTRSAGDDQKPAADVNASKRPVQEDAYDRRRFEFDVDEPPRASAQAPTRPGY